MIETRLKVPLSRDEYAALLKIATEELRNPTDQLRFLLRQELERRGILERNDSGLIGDQFENRRDGISQPQLSGASTGV